MIKIMSLLMVGILFFSGFSTIALYATEKNNYILVTDKLSSSQSVSISEYDMVIITPQLFSADLQPLVEHKSSYGVRTTLKTTEEIYEEYDGRDEPEQIKYFIKDAIEKWGIKYVFLVGGMKSLLWGNPRDNQNKGVTGWHVPVRYANMIEPQGYSIYDNGFISELYFADIYDDEGNFSSWDSSNNGIFAEWNMRDVQGEFDVFDLYPDVCVGRLACRNKKEVRDMVDKIITYETSTYGQEWFKTIVAAGGDVFNDPGTNYIEGEILADSILDNYMSEFNQVKLYASNRDIDSQYAFNPENIIRELSAGCGFFFIDAHGTPTGTKTYWPGEFNRNSMARGISVYHLPRLSNDYKLPICVFGGCWVCQFNVSLFSSNFFSEEYIQFGKNVPECLGWWITRKACGGGIATLGFTALGYGGDGEHGDLDEDGIIEPDYIEKGFGYLEVCFYEAYAKGIDILGEIWRAAISKYLDTWPMVNKNSWDEIKDVEAWVLLGDPSLKIGGYP